MTLIVSAAILSAVGITALSIFKKGDAANKITLDVTDIKNLSVFNWTLSFQAIFESSNPTETPVEFDFIFLEVFTAGIKIAKIEQRKLITIAPQKTTQFSIPIQISLKKIVLNHPYEIAQIVKNGTPKEIKLKGYIKSNGITFPYEEIIEL